MTGPYPLVFEMVYDRTIVLKHASHFCCILFFFFMPKWGKVGYIFKRKEVLLPIGKPHAALLRQRTAFFGKASVIESLVRLPCGSLRSLRLVRHAKCEARGDAKGPAHSPITEPPSERKGLWHESAGGADRGGAHRGRRRRRAVEARLVSFAGLPASALGVGHPRPPQGGKWGYVIH